MRRLHGHLRREGDSCSRHASERRPKGANSGKLAIWVGGDEAVFNEHKHVLDAMGDQVKYIGAIGAGSVAKLVHNCAGYAVQTALAEVFTMGVKAGVPPLELWDAIRQGAGGRRRTFDSLFRRISCRTSSIRRLSSCGWHKGREAGDGAGKRSRRANAAWRTWRWRR